MKRQTWGYFELEDIGHVTQDIPHPLKTQYFIDIAKFSRKEQKLSDRVISDIISKSIEVSITNTPLKELRINIMEY